MSDSFTPTPSEHAPSRRLRGRFSGGTYSPVAAINVTSLVDVMMVLLVIFMVTSPLMQASLDVKLPQAKEAFARDDFGVVITLKRSGEIFVDKDAVPSGQLLGMLQALKVKRRLSSVSLKADRDVPYQNVIEVVGVVKGAGIENLSLVALPTPKVGS